MRANIHSSVGRITLGARGVSSAVSRFGQVLISKKHAQKSGLFAQKSGYHFLVAS